MLSFIDSNNSKIIKKERKSGCFYFVIRKNKMYNLKMDKKITNQSTGQIRYYYESDDEIDLNEFYEKHE